MCALSLGSNLGGNDLRLSCRSLDFVFVVCLISISAGDKRFDMEESNDMKSLVMCRWTTYIMKGTHI